jgi:RNA polymerase sigma-70 factor (ECF subfamily)
MEDLNKQFETLFHTYSDAIFRHLYFRLGNRERAKELTQEVFMKTWQHLAAGKEISFEKAFLYKIAGNLFINEIRTDKTATSLESLIEATSYEPESAAANPLENSEQSEVLRFLEHLADTYREVIVLRYIEGLAVKEIAVLLNEKETNISMRISRGLEKLKQHYRPDEQ